jgi:hypothetical protein
MILRKISAVLASLHYLAMAVKAFIGLPYEINAFGKNSSERYDIFKPLYDNHALDIYDSIINTITWPISLLALVIFFLTFLFEKSAKHQIQNTVNASSTDENSASPNDQPSAGLNILSFLIPLVGLIIYLTERDRSPRKATSAGKAALWGVGVTVILSMISFFVVFSMISSIG